MILLTIIALLLLAPACFAEYVWHSPWAKPETAPQISLIESNDEGLILNIRLYGFYAESANTTAGEFHRIRLWEPVEPETGKPGSPALPEIARLIEIPPTASAAAKVIASDYSDIQGFHPYPRQPALKETDPQPPFTFDPKAYKAADFTPESPVTIGETGVWRRLQVAGLKLHPLQYLPRDGVLRIQRTITVKVDFKSGETPPFNAPPGPVTPQFDRIYREKALNYDPARRQSLTDDEPVGVKYLIITTENAVDYIRPLAELRHAQGLRAEIRATGPGFQTPHDFKNYIRQLYLEGGLEYVLMVGDPYVSSPTIPMYYWDFDPQNPSYSDSWYTCVVPGNDSDHLPELAIGRFVCTRVLDLQHMVNKTLNYLNEYDTSEDWFQRSLLVAHREEYPLKYTQCKEQIRTYSYSIQNPAFSAIYGGAGGSNADIVNYVNTGSCGLFNYRGHGTATSWPVWGSGSFYSAHVAQMNNQNRLFILFDVCCLNGDAVTQTGLCLAESFMMANYAAAAVHAAIRPSYTDPNHVFDREFYRNIYHRGVNHISYASNAASVEVMTQFGTYGQANFRMYYWLGDPAIDLWTHIPDTVEVVTPGRIILGQGSAEFTVLHSGSPVRNAMVCLQNDEIYAVAYSDSMGVARLSFNPLPLQSGSAYLTVSGHNIAFYNDTLEISGGRGVLQGIVTANQTSQPLPGARVFIPHLNLDQFTDSTGLYCFEGIPAMEYTVTAGIEGYIEQTAENVRVDSGGVTILDFALLHPQCAPGVHRIIAAIQPGDSTQIPFSVHNGGDGALEFELEITGDNAGPNLWQRKSIRVSEITGDLNIHGTAYDGENFWITGEGDAQNNHLYRFDREGNLLAMTLQPGAQSPQGFYDICWDGQYLYGAEGSEIFCFDTTGALIDSITGPFSPITTITYDPASDRFYCAGGNYSIREIDRAGAVIQILNHNLNITGLGWRENDPDQMPLYIFSRNPRLTVSKMNPASGELAPVGDIMSMPGEAAGGCCVSAEVDPFYTLLFGVVESDMGDRLLGWQLEKRFFWISVTPDSGTIPPGGNEEFLTDLNAALLPQGFYESVIALHHNAAGGLTEIPVELTVTSAGIIDDEASMLNPLGFRLFPPQPNPFNPNTNLKFLIPYRCEVEFKIFDIQGREVQSFALGITEPGIHHLRIDGSSLTSGIYFIRLKAGSHREAVKILYLK